MPNRQADGSTSVSGSSPQWFSDPGPGVLKHIPKKLHGSIFVGTGYDDDLSKFGVCVK
jgi:hypothetical protein